MDWKGEWRNQYGSIVEITDDARNRISGTFTTALPDSGFTVKPFRWWASIRATASDFVCEAETPAGDPVVSYTGLLRDGKMETLWFVCVDAAIRAEVGKSGKIEKTNWWRAMSISADTFERVP